MENENRKLLLDMSQIVKEYQMGEETVRILKGIDLKIYDGEFVAILGPSGSGKSTLMNIIGCLDVCTSGSVILNGTHVDELTEKELSRIRNKEIGFVFQQFQLLQKLTALKNVELPMIYAGVPEKERRERAKQMLTKVGLETKTLNKPNQLSGGQQQRVAIARALVTNPSILLADEPTGALDQKTGIQIMDLFKSLHAEGKTIIMITHDEKIAQNASRIVRITDGELFEATEVDAKTVESDVDKDINDDITKNKVETDLLLSNKQDSLALDSTSLDSTSLGSISLDGLSLDTLLSLLNERIIKNNSNATIETTIETTTIESSLETSIETTEEVIEEVVEELFEEVIEEVLEEVDEKVDVEKNQNNSIVQESIDVIIDETTNNRISELMELLHLDGKSVVVLTQDNLTGENVSKLIKLTDKESVGDDKC